MKKAAVFFFSVFMLPFLGWAKGDPAKGKVKATTVCAACHGANGISSNPLWPNLKGQKEQYIIK
ncbi:MAG: cytochrome c4, partial [Bdellovibrio sp.]